MEFFGQQNRFKFEDQQSKSNFEKDQAMRTIHLNVPDNVDLRDYDFSMIVATKLYEEAKLSAGQAAEMVGLSKRAFIELLGKYGVSVFSASVSDLHSDIENA